MGSKPWAFIDENGTFRWEQPDAISELYFPLCNDASLMSSITPVLHGDIKQNQHIQVEYINQKLLDYSAYTIKNVRINSREWPVPEKDGKYIKISRYVMQNLS